MSLVQRVSVAMCPVDSRPIHQQGPLLRDHELGVGRVHHLRRARIAQFHGEVPPSGVGRPALPDQLLLRARQPPRQEGPHGPAVLVQDLPAQAGRARARGQVAALARVDVLPVVEGDVLPPVPHRVDVAVHPNVLVPLVAQAVRPQHDPRLGTVQGIVPVVVQNRADRHGVRRIHLGVQDLGDPQFEGFVTLLLPIIQHRHGERSLRGSRRDRQRLARARVILPFGG